MSDQPDADPSLLEAELGHPFAAFTFHRSPDDELAQDHGTLIAWGARFPTGRVAVEWRRSAFPPEKQLDEPHLSEYGSLDDALTVTGGTARTKWEGRP